MASSDSVAASATVAETAFDRFVYGLVDTPVAPLCAGSVPDVPAEVIKAATEQHSHFGAQSYSGTFGSPTKVDRQRLDHIMRWSKWCLGELSAVIDTRMFKHGNLVIAGGYVARAITGTVRDNTDVDVFVVSTETDPGAQLKLVSEAIHQVSENLLTTVPAHFLHVKNRKVTITRFLSPAGHCTTLQVVYTGELEFTGRTVTYKSRLYQIVHKVNPSVRAILAEFDLPLSRVAYGHLKAACDPFEGIKVPSVDPIVYSDQSGAFAHAIRANWPDIRRLGSPVHLRRLAKYTEDRVGRAIMPGVMKPKYIEGRICASFDGCEVIPAANAFSSPIALATPMIEYGNPATGLVLTPVVHGKHRIRYGLKLKYIGKSDGASVVVAKSYDGVAKSYDGAGATRVHGSKKLTFPSYGSEPDEMRAIDRWNFSAMMRGNIGDIIRYYQYCPSTAGRAWTYFGHLQEEDVRDFFNPADPVAFTVDSRWGLILIVAIQKTADRIANAAGIASVNTFDLYGEYDMGMPTTMTQYCSKKQ